MVAPSENPVIRRFIHRVEGNFLIYPQLYPREWPIGVQFAINRPQFHLGSETSTSLIDITRPFDAAHSGNAAR